MPQTQLPPTLGEYYDRARFDEGAALHEELVKCAAELKRVSSAIALAVSKVRKSISLFFTENLLENTDGVLRIPSVFSRGGSLLLLFMLTAALLMTSSHSERYVPDFDADEFAIVASGTELCIDNANDFRGPINLNPCLPPADINQKIAGRARQHWTMTKAGAPTLPKTTPLSHPT